ncbi:MAG TPA: IscS subfamily cysteine desulfurase, partial [Rubrivivax sp.]|nr:IscS subfamily cysteine desulfurase [Rubrivivax sp.]
GGAGAARVRALGDRLWARLAAGIDGLVLHGHPTLRLPGNLHLGIPDVEADALLLALEGVAASAAAACASGSTRPSHVLEAIGAAAPDTVRAALRLGLGRFNTEPETDAAADTIVRAVGRLRGAR